MAAASPSSFRSADSAEVDAVDGEAAVVEDSVVLAEAVEDSAVSAAVADSEAAVAVLAGDEKDLEP